MKIKFLKTSFFAFLLSCLLSCCNQPEPILPPTSTVLVYIAGENSLTGFATTNIDWMLKGILTAKLKATDNLLVYVDQDSVVSYEQSGKEKNPKPTLIKRKPQLIRITLNESGKAVKQILKEYPEQNSASPEVMSEVLSDVFKNPQFDSENKGLILWSHATAWLPSEINGVSAERQRRVRAFGQDLKDWMEIDVLESVLKTYHFDYIIFDACYMASIEVVYALKDFTDYVFAYPTEVMANGLPYHKIIKLLFGFDSLEDSLKKIAELFYDYYDVNKTYNETSATVSIVRSSELEKLAEISQEILSEKETAAHNIDINELQRLDNLKLAYIPQYKHSLYDFNDFVKAMATDEQYLHFEEQLDKVVFFEKHSNRAYYGQKDYDGSHWIKIDRLCGLSTYVPQLGLENLTKWYRNHVSWYARVYKPIEAPVLEP